MTLGSGRVRLEPLEPHHEGALWDVAQDERVWRWMRVRGDLSREAFHQWFESMRAPGTYAFATLVEGVPMGHSSYLNVREDDRVLEIGNTWLAVAAWGTGVNREVKLLLLEHAFEDEHFLRVEFKTDANNPRSRAALAGLPAQFEGIFRKHMIVRGGERRDSAWYSVIDDEWPLVKASLRERLGRDARET